MTTATGRHISRRKFLIGAAGATAGGLVLSRSPFYLAANALPAVETAHPTATPRLSATVEPTSFNVKPRGGQTFLLNPNKGNFLNVELPLASAGGVPKTVVLPPAGGLAAPLTRTVYFRQPLTGATVNPNLQGLKGSLPKWGSKGNGSTDIVVLESTNDRTWSIEGHLTSARSAGHSILETAPGAPAASIDPMSLPAPILLWSAADMWSSTANGTTFPTGSAVGTDYSGSGNNLIVNVGETMTFRKGPLPGTGSVPRGLPGFAYVTGSGSRGGMGCTFQSGDITSWTILVALYPGDEAQGGGFDEEQVFRVRSGSPLLFPLKYGNMGYTYDGNDYNNIYWNSNPFAGTSPLPSIVGWSARGGKSYSTPTMVAGSTVEPVQSANQSSGTTTTPAAISGLDISNGYGLSAVAVYAQTLSAGQTAQAARRLAFVSYGGRD